MDYDLNERLFNFGVRCLKHIRFFPNTPEYKTIRFQLSKSATSAGANYEEAQAASSRADFRNKIKISLREMRESNYWLRVTKALEEDSPNNVELLWLLKESEELKKILGAIARNTK